MNLRHNDMYRMSINVIVSPQTNFYEQPSHFRLFHRLLMRMSRSWTLHALPNTSFLIKSPVQYYTEFKCYEIHQCQSVFLQSLLTSISLGPNILSAPFSLTPKSRVIPSDCKNKFHACINNQKMYAWLKNSDAFAPFSLITCNSNETKFKF